MRKGIEIMDVASAFNEAKDCEYTLGYTIEGIVAGKTDDVLSKVNVEDFTEVRFFSEEKEIHIFPYEDIKQAICTTNAYGQFVVKKYLMEEKLGAGKYLYVKEFLDYDEDGQLQIGKTCLLKFEA